MNLNKHTLILIASDGVQVGKTTFASFFETYLEKEIVLRESFAEPLKDMLRVLLTKHLPTSPAEVANGLNGHLKESQVGSLKHNDVTYRKLMQTLGTEWREVAGCNNLWGEVMLHKLETRAEWADNKGKKAWVLVDDFRFPLEGQFLQNTLDADEWQVITVMVTKDKVTSPLAYVGHKSEGSLQDWLFDYVVVNSGSKGSLYEKAAEVAISILTQQQQQ